MKKFLLPVIIIFAGIIIMVGLIQSSSSEERQEVVVEPQKVKIVVADVQSYNASIETSGVVQSAQSVTLIPQVSGKIGKIAKDLQPGRRFEKGDMITQIERKDYQLAVKQEKSRVRQAELELKLEKERQSAAQREWELLGNKGKAPELAARKPQLDVSRLRLSSAKAGYKRAKLSLSRTKIVAPFNSILKSEQLEVGQVVGPGTPVAQLLGTDQYWVRVSVPVARLSDILIPDVNAKEGSTADVVYLLSNSQKVQRAGKVLRLEGELDAQAKTANVLIGIDKPLAAEGTPLIIGAFVQVRIQGRLVENVVKLPVDTLRDGNHVLIVDKNKKLARQDVEVAWSDQRHVYIKSGITTGMQIVSTPISSPVYGTPLTILSEKQ